MFVRFRICFLCNLYFLTYKVIDKPIIITKTISYRDDCVDELFPFQPALIECCTFCKDIKKYFHLPTFPLYSNIWANRCYSCITARLGQKWQSVFGTQYAVRYQCHNYTSNNPLPLWKNVDVSSLIVRDGKSSSMLTNDYTILLWFLWNLIGWHFYT